MNGSNFLVMQYQEKSLIKSALEFEIFRHAKNEITRLYKLW